MFLIEGKETPKQQFCLSVGLFRIVLSLVIAAFDSNFVPDLSNI